MAELRFDKQADNDRYFSTLETLGVVLPLRLDDENVGDILDHAGVTVLTVDVNNERPDEDVTRLAETIALAINTCGGFRSERSEPSSI
ncbi:hypothetical protein [Sphingomonas alpina]|uniref:Uncharacterized protein n=1 Tax=Sphingomonas alpina TaxID=653931 RepID=A0A7H0LHY5_9SPHN|nr:hypothetical protein [Sphingomonas alpina]QNQ09288.1 hypothetical protein H3Z74_21880 [Sphingomonas alpina]